MLNVNPLIRDNIDDSASGLKDSFLAFYNTFTDK